MPLLSETGNVTLPHGEHKSARKSIQFPIRRLKPIIFSNFGPDFHFWWISENGKTRIRSWLNISRVIKGAAAMPLLLVALVIILMLAERKVISLISSAVKNDLVKLTLKVVCTKLLFFQRGLKGSCKVYFIMMNWTYTPWIFYNRIEILLPIRNEIFTLSPQRIWLLLTRRDASQFCHSCHTFCQSLCFSRPFHFKAWSMYSVQNICTLVSMYNCKVCA